MKKKEYEPSKLDDVPEDFARWWHPHSRDSESGADIGGHPDAERVWARKEPGRWRHRTYGTNARVAWNAQTYRSEYLSWVEVGRPDRKPFISVAETLDRHFELLRQIKPILSEIGKPMPKPQPFDIDPDGAEPF